MSHILISDPTLRDGNHAISHQLDKEQIIKYTKAMDQAKIPIVEVGHGNGLGASSLQVGKSLLSDREMLTVAREHLKYSKLAIHVIPGFATIKKDLEIAIDLGVDIVRVASHCTEADITKRHIEYVNKRNKTPYGVLMMSHMTTPEILLNEAKKMESYGAQGVIIMDSAGAYLPKEVRTRISNLIEHLNIAVGFHAHNNLGLALANSIAAVEAGATILDGTAKGFGAGAGNTQLEILIAVLHKLGYQTGVDLFKVLDAVDLAEEFLIKTIPYSNSLNIVSGLAGVFSGFVKHVKKASLQFKIDPRILFLELGKRNVIAGQEDLIIEIAQQLGENEKTYIHS